VGLWPLNRAFFVLSFVEVRRLASDEMRWCEIQAAKGNLCQGVLKPLYRGYFQPKELARGELFGSQLVR
jgi:hypothetical protein